MAWGDWCPDKCGISLRGTGNWIDMKKRIHEYKCFRCKKIFKRIGKRKFEEVKGINDGGKI